MDSTHVHGLAKGQFLSGQSHLSLRHNPAATIDIFFVADH